MPPMGELSMMRRPIYFKLDPCEKFDLIGLLVDSSKNRIANLEGCKLSHIASPELYFKPIFMDQIVKYGLTTYLGMDWILEDLTTPRTPPEDVDSILIQFLSQISIDDELIIIDPYFFAPSIDSQYVTRICSIIKPFLGRLKELKIVTASHRKAFNNESKDLVLSGLNTLSDSLHVTYKHSNELHDRFWISNKRKKGIITGTSLNGLGKKYAVIDYLQDEDVEAIVSEFNLQHLI